MKSIIKVFITVAMLFTTSVGAISLQPDVIFAAKKNGWVLTNNVWYYYVNDVKKTGWLTENNAKYYLKPDGAKAIGWVLVNGNWYYMNPNGQMLTGWKYYNNYWYFLKSDGSMAVGWVYPEENLEWYYLAPSGEMLTGWQYVDRAWYYINADGYRATGWITYNKKKYYLKPNGTMASGWNYIQGDWYYFESSGALKTGWYKEWETWFFLGGNGKMQVGWLANNGYWYYFAQNGYMQTGWVDYKENRYFLSPSGEMATGWLQIGGTWYYLDSGTGALNPNKKPEVVATNYQYLDIRYPSKVTAAEINNYISAYEKKTGKTSGLRGLGQTIIDTAKAGGVNPLILASMTIHESGYGTNPLTKYKNNLFSVAAYDSAAYDSAYTFNSIKQAMQYQINFLKEGYLNPSSWKFKGYFLGDATNGLNYYYATDKDWGSKIAAHAQKIHPFNTKEYTSIELMNGSTFDVSIPKMYTDFSSMGIIAIANSNIPLTSSYQGTNVVGSIPAGSQFTVLRKYNDHSFYVLYEGKKYFLKISISNYKQYFTILNLLRDSNFNYTVQSSIYLPVPAGYSPVYR